MSDEVLVLAEADVRALIDTRRAVELAREVLAGPRDTVRQSAPSAMKLDARDLGGPRFMFKAATVGHLGASGIRLIAWPTAGDAAMYTLLFDHDSGRPAALVSGRWLSDVRAAAFGVAVARALLPTHAVTAALYGAGGIARELAAMLCSTVPLRELRVSSRRIESARRLADELAPRAPCPIRTDVAPDRFTDGAELVVTLTSSETPLVRRGMLGPGAVLCSMGSGNEVDFAVLEDGDRLVVDDPDYACVMGDGAAWIAQGRLTRDAFTARIDALAHDVVSGAVPGRTDGRGRIVALVQGLTTGDVAFAQLAVDTARARGSGRAISLRTSDAGSARA